MTPHELEQEKLLALGRLTRGLIHELNNPVGTVLAFAQILLDAPRSDDDQKALKYIEESAQACKATLEKLQRFARPMPNAKRAEDVGALVDEALSIARPMLKIYPRANITVEKAKQPVEVMVEHGTVILALVSLLTVVMPLLADLKAEVQFAWARDEKDGTVVLSVTVDGQNEPAAAQTDGVANIISTQGGSFQQHREGRAMLYRLRLPANV